MLVLVIRRKIMQCHCTNFILAIVHAQVDQNLVQRISDSDMQKQVSALQTSGKITDKSKTVTCVRPGQMLSRLEWNTYAEGEKIAWFHITMVSVICIYVPIIKSHFVLQTGSHMDSVPQRGTFDEGAGVIAGLEAISALIMSKPYWR